MPKKAVNIETLTVSVEFDSGNKSGFGLAALSSEIRDRLALHGLSQKLGDSWAGKPEQAEDTVGQVWDSLKSGDWNTRGTGQAPILVRAILRLDPTLDEIETREKVSNLGKAEKSALMKNKAIKATIATIKAEEAQRKLEQATKADDGSEADDIFDIIG